MALLNKFLIAYSGGMDSHVLLHKLVALRQQNPALQLRAAHIHHGLSKNADSWVEHCGKICADLKVDYIVKYIKVNKHKGHSLEATARDLRYQEFAKLLAEDEYLVTAHHADDQAETVLLQLFRGSGVDGLAAMPAEKGKHLRPLLHLSRQELYQYAKQNNLHWIEDESNENIGIDRNFIRHKLLPNIKAKWPGVVTALGRTAKNCAAASEVINILAEHDYAKILGSVPNTLSIKKTLNLSIIRQNNVIRYWLGKLNLPIPSKIKLQHIRTDALNCRTDAKPLVHWRGAEVRRYKDDLYAMEPLGAFDPKTKIQELQNSGILKQYGENIAIRFRQPGDGLKKIMQEHNIPPWLRDRIPLLYRDGVFVAVVSP